MRAAITCVLALSLGAAFPLSAVEALTATGYDRRIDLQWLPVATGKERFTVERAERPEGPFVPIATGHRSNIYSDFFGENDRTYYYRVSSAAAPGHSPSASGTVMARSQAMTDEQLLDSVQAATFRYFWDYAHPVSGLARERSGHGLTCATGGTGFGLFALMVGAERGFVPRATVAQRVLMMLTFLDEKAEHFHGSFPHWINGATGRTLPFSAFVNGTPISLKPHFSSRVP